MPEEVVGFFISFPTAVINNSNVLQLYYTNTNNLYIRTIFSGNQGTWRLINAEDDFIIRDDNYLINILTNGGGDFKYKYISNSILTNLNLIQYLPLISGGTFINYETCQFYLANNNCIYFRKKYSTGLTQWQEVFSSKNIYTIEKINNLIEGGSDGHLHVIPFYNKIVNNNIIIDDSERTNAVVESSTNLYETNIYPSNTAYYVYIIPSKTNAIFYFYDIDSGYNIVASNKYNTHIDGTVKYYGYYSYADLQNIGFCIKTTTRLNVKTSDIYAKLLVWDGCNFGPKLITYGNTFDNDGNYDPFPEKGGMNLLVGKRNLILIAKEDYTFINCISTNSSSKNIISSSNNISLPSQILYFNENTGSKFIKLVKNYNYSTGEYDPVTFTGCINDYVSAIPNQKTVTIEPPVMNKCYYDLMNMQWECKKDIYGANTTFALHQGVTYNGCPYGSRWTTASFICWHLSIETFLNAANDPDSIIYDSNYSFIEFTNDDNATEGSYSGSYYGNVCTSWATLMSDFPYPMTNFSFRVHPFTTIRKVNQFCLNELHTNYSGHSIVPIAYEFGEAFRNNPNLSAQNLNLIIAEQVGPLSRIYKFENGVVQNYNPLVVSYDYPILYKYVVNYFDKRLRYNGKMVYSSTVVDPMNGDARPYKGHKCVYTSDDSVLINIKNNASTLYLTNKTTNTTVNFNVSSLTQYEIDKSNLADNCIYEVYTDTSSIKEQFEYHDVSNILYYTISDGIVSFSDNREFWYFTCAARSVEVSSDSGCLSCAYESSGDYSLYRQTAIITGIYSVFCKGTLGAYILHIQQQS